MMRPIVIGMLLSAIAVESSPSRMRFGTIDCIAGPPTTKPKPTRSDPASTGTAADMPRSPGSAKNHTAAKPEPATQSTLPRRIWRAGFPVSAHLPLVGLRISCGPNCATPTSPTISADPVASYITIAATMPCVHTATTANILPQNSAPNTGSNISPSAPRGRGGAVASAVIRQPGFGSRSQDAYIYT